MHHLFIICIRTHATHWFLTGTHWIWEIINMLLQGKTDYRRETKESLMLEMIPDLRYAEQEKSPRILNTHLPYRWLPNKHIENGWKIVHMMRNPKDVLVSMFHHLKSTGTLDKDMKWAEFFNEAIKGRRTVHSIYLCRFYLTTHTKSQGLFLLWMFFSEGDATFI